jgi:preprotein translocase subunit SecY
MSTRTVSKQTQKNWWIDTALFVSAIVAALSGIYFLFLPSGGFQGGRNPLYNIQILFTRQTWDDLHTWGGVAMIAAAAIHLAIHWPWVVSMARRTWNELTGQCGCMNPRGRSNLILNVIVATSLLVTAISGVYFLFVPGGRWAADPMILFTRTSWDLIHTWAGVALIAAAIIYFAIHWKWVAKVTRKMIGMITPSRSVQQPVPVAIS